MELQDPDHEAGPLHRYPCARLGIGGKEVCEREQGVAAGNDDPGVARVLLRSLVGGRSYESAEGVAQAS
jgi:hypothetical protein